VFLPQLMNSNISNCFEALAAIVIQTIERLLELFADLSKETL
jgi:hypothetical protein